ncbi:MAG TPA: hemerythrin domain-containing protein [Polyangia bacterium]|nr:hemerythrin domain-containing protein [Polyangia bacterium]
MSAIDMLESQHREVEKLFAAFEKANAAKKREIFLQIADKLAVHATIEEKHFYPAAKSEETKELLAESVEEHLSVKRLLADLLDEDDQETLEAKVKVLKEQIEHHVEEEENELFPQVEDLLDATALDALEQEMTATQEELLSEGNPREHIPDETAEAAPI